MSGPWFVRLGSRRAGPFDAERLRVMAQRGALTRTHAVSADGKAWVRAGTLRAVFNADGSVVAPGTRPIDVEPDADEAAGFGAIPEGEPMELPSIGAPRARVGSARVRPAVIGALVLATAALAMPTSRDEAGAVAWWWSEGALAIAVRGLSAAATIGAWVVAFMAPEPARSASVAAVAAVLAAAASATLVPWAPWAAMLGPLVAVSAVLVALDAAGSRSVATVGKVAMGAAALLGGGSLVVAILQGGGWEIAGGVLGLLGAAGIGAAGLEAVRGAQARPGRVFWSCVGGAVGALAGMFAGAFGALGGTAPMQAAEAATSACLVLSFATLAWAAVHEVGETILQLPPDPDSLDTHQEPPTA